jgi:tRNA U34 5-carboxymethylaminomethyl modifying enzyme MnmG/GidA
MGKLGVGVIGCGMISGNHFHALEKLEKVALQAVCDIDKEKLQKAMEAQHVDGCADWRDLISRDDIDAVHICVPHHLHAEISIAALRAGKHVLCEKPMGVSLREARAMEEKLLPADAPYMDITGLRMEARQKLSAQRPRSIGQAGRIPGVSPADVAVLLVWLKKQEKDNALSS